MAKTKNSTTARGRGWTLRLMGDPALISPAGDEHLLERRAAALLALVALEPGVARRRIASLLWPDSDESTARQALRQQLLRLRKLGGGELLTGNGSLRLAGHVASDLASEAPRSALLGSFDYGDGEELARWVERERHRLRRDAVERISRSLAQAESAGDLAAALAFARQLLEADPDTESNHRHLMRLHYLAGDTAQAQAAYERLRQLLDRDFQARPSAETEKLARTIRAAREVPATTLPPPSVLRPPRLVGREREWGALDTCWATGTAALVFGVGGMGKTRLIGDFCATKGGAVMVAARPGDASAAYSLLARLLRALVARVGSPLPPGLADQLARLLPELGKAPALRADSDRAPLGRAIEALVELAIGGGLAAIAIDDLHYADAASLEALQGPLALAGRLRLVLAFRNDEITAAGRTLADSLVASGGAHRVELAPLTEAQVAELLRSLEIPGFDDARLAVDVKRHTGGNPLFVLETVKAMLLEGHGVGGEHPLPAAANVTALIARRLAKLSPRALAIARCAGVAGQDFSIELAAHVLGVRPLELADAWAELESADVLRDGAFEHDLIQEAAAASVPAAIARRLHADIAAYLEGAGTEPGRVAGHWGAARRPKEASAAYMRAAARAREAGRRIEESDLLAHAARAFGRCDERDARFEALLARAEAMACNDLGEATLEAVLAAEEAACGEEQRMRALLTKAEFFGNRSESEAAVREGRAGIALANRARRVDIEARFSIVVAGGLCELRRVDEALAILERFRDTAASGLEPRASVEYLVQLGITLDLANRLSDALAAFESARGIAVTHGFKDLLATSLSNLATTTSKRGELTRASGFGHQALQLWREAEPLRGTPVQTQALLAHRLRDIGHYGAAIAMLEESLEEFRRAGTRYWVFATAHRLALAYAHVGQHARAVKLLAEEPGGLPQKLQAIWLAHRAEVARLSGGGSIKPVREALSLLGGDVDDGNNRLVSLFAAAIVAPEEGEAMATAVAAWAAARERFGMAIAAHVRAAACALAVGAIERARPQVEAALRLGADYEPDNFYRAELWWVAHEVFRASGAPSQAARALAAGSEWVRRIAAEHVPREFRDSFLTRNPVNRVLLAAARGAP